VGTIQRMRADVDSTVISVRRDDLSALAIMYGLPESDLAVRLVKYGVLMPDGPPAGSIWVPDRMPTPGPPRTT
jgi:hypothetical protein